MSLLFISILFAYLSLTNCFNFKDLKGNFLSLFGRSNNKEKHDLEIKSSSMRHFQKVDTGTKQVLKAFKLSPDKEKKSNITVSLFPPDLNTATELSWLQQKPKRRTKFRRQYKYLDSSSHDTQRESSTSTEMKQWKEDFDVDWYNKKMKAIAEQTSRNLSQAYNYNIAAARPWSKPCGDPNQYNLPWGTCTMMSECDAEYRIYRGDPFCGRQSLFVCCALQLTQHDLYQALDMSFIHTSDDTSSEEGKKRKLSSKEAQRQKVARQKTRIRKARFRRKRQIKKRIRKIARQIRKELNRAFRNATDNRRRRVRKLKQLIKTMKKKFLLDRKAAKDVLDVDFKNIDNTLQTKLSLVKKLNHDFLMNDTFREILFGQNPNVTAVRTLLAAYPELEGYMRSEPDQQVNITSGRRSGNGVIRKKKKTKRKDYLEYDIEYGALYF